MKKITGLLAAFLALTLVIPARAQQAPGFFVEGLAGQRSVLVVAPNEQIMARLPLPASLQGLGDAEMLAHAQLVWSFRAAGGVNAQGLSRAINAFSGTHEENRMAVWKSVRALAMHKVLAIGLPQSSETGGDLFNQSVFLQMISEQFGSFMGPAEKNVLAEARTSVQKRRDAWLAGLDRRAKARGDALLDEVKKLATSSSLSPRISAWGLLRASRRAGAGLQKPSEAGAVGQSQAPSPAPIAASASGSVKSKQAGIAPLVMVTGLALPAMAALAAHTPTLVVSVWRLVALATAIGFLVGTYIAGRESKEEEYLKLNSPWWDKWVPTVILPIVGGVIGAAFFYLLKGVGLLADILARHIFLR